MNRKALYGRVMRIATAGYHLLLRITRPITMGVRTVVLYENQVLLVRHTYQDGWMLPGGGVKRNETLDQAACRETREETGIAVQDVSLVGVYTKISNKKTNHIAVFWCSIPATVLAESPSLEIAEQRFFPVDALPTDIHPGHGRRVAEALRRKPELYSSAW